ncbi:hypothetical protein O1611_g6959 [Lasiodiplodia mahajangana]|uniref:Uncharacterized protein n=1 Tax=Lasiodiplodia mahajangana TaxID=1108764 RepID=A0ACC2JGS2_9PEZI|nr:hypothetical protein O1611_g6959 [Lasiodiplodia mahajangana]
MWNYNWRSPDHPGYTKTKIEEITTNLAALAKSRPAEECAEYLVELLLDLMVKCFQKCKIPITHERYNLTFTTLPSHFGIDYNDPLNVLVRDESFGQPYCVYLHRSAPWQIPMLWHRRDNMLQLSNLLPLMPGILGRMFTEYRTAEGFDPEGTAGTAKFLQTFPISYQMAAVARLRLQFPQFQRLPPELTNYTLRPGWGEVCWLIHIGIVKIVNDQIQVVTLPFDFSASQHRMLFSQTCRFIGFMEDGDWLDEHIVKTWTIHFSPDCSLHDLPEASSFFAPFRDHHSATALTSKDEEKSQPEKEEK